MDSGRQQTEARKGKKPQLNKPQGALTHQRAETNLVDGGFHMTQCPDQKQLTCSKAACLLNTERYASLSPLPLSPMAFSTKAVGKKRTSWEDETVGRTEEPSARVTSTGTATALGNVGSTENAGRRQHAAAGTRCNSTVQSRRELHKIRFSRADRDAPVQPRIGRKTRPTSGAKRPGETGPARPGEQL
nr:unnamed protein product [Digitaria exilis]